MLDPVRAWHEEHVYFQRLLRLLQREVEVFHAGEEPNYRLMCEIVDYLRDWGDQVHHPREDEAFRRLVAHRPEQRVPVMRLQQEHRVIERAGEALLGMLQAIESGDILKRAEVEVAAATYLVYFGNHISSEEEDILPLAASELRAEDWDAVRAIAPRGPHPPGGQEPYARYRTLRREIEAQIG